MMTKQQEHEALERIKNILADAGDDSYIGMAFTGCVEDAESNIENDWALSMASRWQSAESKVEALKAQVAELQQVRNAQQGEIERLSAKCADTAKAAESLNKWRTDEHNALERERCRAEAAEAEIIRLKAKLYDFITAQG